jgi:predicted metal-binding membrane protein
MEAARARPTIDARQAAIVAVLIGLALVGWLVTDDRMAGMDAGPGTDPGALGFYVSAWVVMMAAMMFPSISPMVVAYSTIEHRKRELGRGGGAGRGSIALFVGGYLVTWTAFGLVAYALYAGVRSLDIAAFSWSSGGRYLAGGVIAAAAIYQLTPLKNVCLTKCRSPLGFVVGAWRDGRWGALAMGAEHGGWCVGCCWGLMAALFALGVMSLGWMILVAALIAAEKMLPWKRVANYGVAAVLVALAIGVALTPRDVPGLTLPDSHQAGKAMDAMNGP